MFNNKWAKLTKDRWVLDVIHYGHTQEFFERSPTTPDSKVKPTMVENDNPSRGSTVT